jgi:hypothetical protein
MSTSENITITNNELLNMITSLSNKIETLEKKFNKLESDSQYNIDSWDFKDEVILEEKIFKSICFEPPEILRQNAFNLSVS